MSPLTDPSLSTSARVVLAVLVFALLAALAGAMTVLVMASRHPVQTVVEIGVATLGIAVVAVWNWRRRRTG